MAGTKNAPNDADLDPLQSQRKILTGLLARFTADRDLLISTVQACEERLQTLANRLEAVPIEEQGPNGSGPNALEEVRQSLIQLEQAQRQAAKLVDDCRAISAQALARADAALNRGEELARNDKQAALAAAACTERIEALAARVEANEKEGEQLTARAEAAQRALTELVEAQQRVAKATEDSVAKSQQALARAETAFNRSEELARNDKQATFSAALEACSQRIEAVKALAEANRVNGEQLTARAEAAVQRCEQLAQASREPKNKQLQALAKAIDRVTTDVARLKADAAQPQELLSKLVNRVAGFEAQLADMRRAAAEAGRAGTAETAVAGSTTPAAAPESPPMPASTPTPRLWPLSLAIGIAALLAVFAFVMFSSKDEPRLASSVVRTGAQQRPAKKIALPAKPAPPEPAKPAAPEPAKAAVVEPAAPAPAAEPPTSLSVETRQTGAAMAPAAAAAATAKDAAGASPEQKSATTSASAKPEPQSPQGPARLVSLQPDGAVSLVLQPKEKKACIYRSDGGKITVDHCYPILAARVKEWAPWLVASDINAQRIHLVDDGRHKRLRIVPENHPLWDNTVRLPQSAFTALSEKVKPWSTVWLTTVGGTQPTLTEADAASLRKAVAGWRQAWDQGRFDDYFGFYSAAFTPESGGSVSHWWNRKRSLFERSGAISVQLGATTITTGDTSEEAIVSFEQLYHSALLTSRCFKVLRWRHEGNGWKIVSETVLLERKT